MIAESVGYAEAGAKAAPAASAGAIDRTTRTTRVARNLLVVLLSQIVIWIAGSGLAILLPRYLGDTNVGRLTFALSFTSMFTLVVLFGSEKYITREVARHPESAGHLAFNALATRIPLIVICTAMMVAFLTLLHYPESTRVTVYVFAASMCVTALGNTVIATLQGLERMTLTSLASILEKLISGIIGVGAVAFAGQGMIMYALILVFANAISVAIVTAYFLRIVGFSRQLDLRLCRELLRGGVPFLVWGISLLIYGTIDITMLSIMTNDEVVGWYGTAYRFIGIATFFPFSMNMALLPSISSTSVAESRQLVRRSLDLVMLTSVPIAVFFFFGASAIIDFLGYPEGFRHSVILLQILSLHIPLTAFTMIAGTVLVAQHREGPRTLAAVAAAILNPVMNLAAIPYFEHANGNGAIGAAITSVIIEIFMLVIMLRLLERGVFATSNLYFALRCLAAGVPMALAMIVASPYGLIPMALLGGLAFFAGSMLFRAMTIKDMVDLPRLVLARGRVEEVPA